MSSQAESSSAFLRAARSGQEDVVVQALTDGMPINTCNSNGLNALHLAAKEGHTDIVKTLLLRGADIEAETRKGNTALHISSLAGQYETTDTLIAKGANVNSRSLPKGFTPLYMAAQENHIDVVELLLQHKADQNITTEDGFTPLAIAIQQGHDDVVRILRDSDTKQGFGLIHDVARRNDVQSAMYLIKSGVDIEGVAKYNFTPLHVACHYGSTDVARLLLDYGARVDTFALNNVSPLHVACNKGYVELVQLLLQHRADQEAITKDGLLPLHTASRHGKDDVVAELLHDRSDLIEGKSKSGLTPLHLASQGNHVGVMKLLLAFNAYVDTLTNDNITSLHISAHYGHVDASRFLLDSTAEPNATSLNGFTPLHVACKKNRIQVVLLLLERGSSIQAQTQAGLSPLHVATFFGNYEIVELLVQKGASIDSVDRKGETALHVSGRIRREEISQYLLKMGANADAKARQGITPLHIISYLGHGEMIQTLIDYGASPDAMTKSCQTPLQIACKEGHTHVVDVLLQNGASLSLTTKAGYTPLHTATKYGRTTIVNLLLKKFASPDAEGKNGITPLHVAAHYDRVEIAILLLGHGASPYLRVKNGFTPLHIACKRGHLKIVKILLEHKAVPNEQTRNGIAPIHLAAQYGYDNIVKVLIEYDADTGIPAKNGMTPLHLAAQEDYVNMAAMLLDYGAPINAVTLAGYTSLHVACYYGNTRTALLLLRRGAGVNDQTKDGLTPLHMAAQQGHAAIVDAFAREYSADCQLRTANGLTALQLAYFANQDECVRILQQFTQEEYISDEQMAQMRSAAVMEMNLRPEVLRVDDEESTSDNVSVYYPDEDADWHDLHRTNLEKYYTSLSERYVSMRVRRDRNELMHAREVVRPDGSIMYITETTIKPKHGNYRTVQLEDGSILYLVETLYLPMEFVAGETREVRNADGSITLVTEMSQPPEVGEYKVLTRADGSMVYIVETTYMPPPENYDETYNEVRTREIENPDGSVTYITESNVPPPEGEYRTETRPDGTVVYITEITYSPQDQVSGEAVTREVRHSDGSLTLITETTFMPPDGRYRKSKRPDGTIVYIIEVNYVPVNDFGEEVVREMALPDGRNVFYLETYYMPQGPHETIQMNDGSVIYRQELHERVADPRIIAVTRDDNTVYCIRETTYIPGDDKYRAMRRDDGAIVFLDENLPSQNRASPVKEMAPVRRPDGSVVYISKFTYLPPSGPFKAMKRSDGTVEYYGEQSYMPAPVKKVTRADGTVVYITESTYMPAVGKFRAMRKNDGSIVYITEQQYRPQSADEDRITEVRREDGSTVYITETTRMPSRGPYKAMKRADGTIVYIIESTSMPSQQHSAGLGPSPSKKIAEQSLGAIAEEPSEYPPGAKVSKKPSFGRRLKKTFSFRKKKSGKEKVPPAVPPRPDDDALAPPVPPPPTDEVMPAAEPMEETGPPPIPPPPMDDEAAILAGAASLRRTSDPHREEIEDLPESPEKQDFTARRSMFENKIQEQLKLPGQEGRAFIVPTPDNRIRRRLDTPALKPASRVTTYNTVTTNVVHNYQLVDEEEMQDMEAAAEEAAIIADERAKAEAAQKGSKQKSAANLRPPEGIEVDFDEFSDPNQGTVVGPAGGTLISTHFGIRIVIPPNALHSQIKINCRLLEKKSPSGRIVQPGLQDGEALANRVLEISPSGTHFLKPISIEIPYFVAVEGYNREVYVMSSEKGDGWSDHRSYRVLPHDENSDDDEYYVAISTQSLPSYYAVVSRICREDADINNDGGEIYSSYVPFVRVDVPADSFHKEGDSYIQVLPVNPDDLSTTGICGATPILTLEPRIRLKQSITVTLPDLQVHPKADPNNPVRLLRSITPYDKQPQWEDITESTEMIDEGDGTLSFNTNQFARYWIVQVRQALTAKDKGSALYRKLTAVPYLANVAVFANSYQPGEASLRILCMTNDGRYDSLDYQEGMVQVATKDNIPIIDGSRVSIQSSGNLLPIKAKSAAWQLDFKPFRENLINCSIRVTTPSDPPKGVLSFIRDAKVDGKTISHALCSLGIVLPQGEGPDGNVTTSHEYRVFAETMDIAIEEIAEHGIESDTTNDDQSNAASVAAAVGNDWPHLARELQLRESDIRMIDLESASNSTAAAQRVLHLWAVRSGRDATGVKLESALVGIEREDVIEHFESEVPSGVTYEKTQLPGGQIVIKKKISRRLPPQEIEKLKKGKDVIVTAEGHIVQTKQTIITTTNGDREQMLARLRQHMDEDELELRNSAAGEILSEEIEFHHDDADKDLVDKIRNDVERRRYDHR